MDAHSKWFEYSCSFSLLFLMYRNLIFCVILKCVAAFKVLGFCLLPLSTLNYDTRSITHQSLCVEGFVCTPRGFFQNRIRNEAVSFVSPFKPSLLTLCTKRLYIKNVYILTRYCVYVFFMYLRT